MPYNSEDPRPGTAQRRGWVVVIVIVVVVLGVAVLASALLRSPGRGIGAESESAGDAQPEAAQDPSVELELVLVDGRDSYAVSESVRLQCVLTNNSGDTIEMSVPLFEPGKPFDPLSSGVFLDVDFCAPGGEWTRLVPHSGNPSCVVFPRLTMGQPQRRVAPGQTVTLTPILLGTYFRLDRAGLLRVQARFQATGVKTPSIWVGSVRSPVVELELRGSPLELVTRVRRPLGANETGRLSELVEIVLRNNSGLPLATSTFEASTRLEVRGPLEEMVVEDGGGVQSRSLLLGPGQEISLLGAAPLWDRQVRRTGTAPAAIRVGYSGTRPATDWIELPLTVD